ncbi:hypothetical protein [Streptomyces longwoodensis]|uniref:hypothetical protein n=1 Tax=Streptomyces longwoodensis TaxID=68231 RepID=UPI0033D181F4
MTMMFGYDHDVSGWGWFVTSDGVLLLWTLIITIAVLLNRSGEHVKARTTPSAEDVLDERQARERSTKANSGLTRSLPVTGLLSSTCCVQ